MPPSGKRAGRSSCQAVRRYRPQGPSGREVSELRFQGVARTAWRTAPIVCETYVVKKFMYHFLVKPMHHNVENDYSDYDEFKARRTAVKLAKQVGTPAKMPPRRPRGQRRTVFLQLPRQIGAASSG